MSKQFRFCLLPSDIHSLMTKLGEQADLKILQETTLNSRVLELDSPVRPESARFHIAGASSVRCFLAKADGKVRVKFIGKQSHWIIDTDSEVIEFSGCDFDNSVLLIGRFYFHNDVLIGDSIWPKRKEFLTWADRVFRIAKGTMRNSKPLDAYVGKDAEQWWRNGGRFAAAIWPSRPPVFEEEI